MHSMLVERQGEFEKAIEHLRSELVGLRTGRAHPALVEGIIVMAYGAPSPLKNLAQVAVPDSKTLQIEPWDASIVKDIEKGILESELGITPTVDGKTLRISMPQMTEEDRKRLVKVMKGKLEDARVAVRQIREDVRNKITRMVKEGEANEDEKFKVFEEVDKLTKDYTSKIDDIGAEKEKEIMTI